MALEFPRYLVLLSLLACSACNRPQPKAERIFPVTIGTVVQQDVPVYIDAIGNVFALQNVDIRPQVGGIIQETYVQEGKYVKKGDPLFKIDPRPYQAALDKAKAAVIKDKATLQFSEEQIKRNAELVKKDFVAKLTFEQYESQQKLNQAQVQADEADVETATLNLEWTTPISPIDGKVSQFNLKPGNLVTVDDATVILNIRQMDPVEIRFNINQTDFIALQDISKGKPTTFEVILPQDVKNPRAGTIFFIDNHVDLTTGTILLKGTVENKDEFLWPGEFINVKLLLKIDKDALLVPSEAVKIGQDGNYVYIYQQNTSTAEYRLVTKGPRFNEQVVIEKGITKNDTVIVTGQNNLLPGSKVNVITGASTTAPKKGTP